MIRSITLRAFVAVVACAAALPAATRAADAKAPDLSSPKAAALVFAKAISDGDKAAIRAVCHGKEDEIKAIESMANALAAIRKFRNVCNAKFGADNVLSKGLPSDPDLAKEAEKAEFKIDGDTATSVTKPGEDPADKATLKKIDGKWKVDVASIGKEKLAQSVQMEKLGKVFNEAATEIEAGKYKTAEEAAIAIGPKMQEAMK